MPKARPLIYRGQKFSSQNDLAYHLGLSPAAISLRVKKGNVNDPVFTKDELKANLQLGPLSNRTPVRVGSLSWPSQKDAAAYFGVSTSFISKSLNMGTFEAWARKKLARRGGMAPSRGE